jgi:hypothetical protein
MRPLQTAKMSGANKATFLSEPAEPRRDHALRHAWRAVLTGDEAIASNMGPCSAGPRLKPQPCGRQVWAVGVEVEDDLDQVSNDD